LENALGDGFIRKESEVDTGYQAKVLAGAGRTQSGIGWFIVIIGIFGLLVGAGMWSQQSALMGAPIMGIAVLIAVMGFLTVAAGQMITCFVQIERNTNKILEKMSP
jgi:hypothetical protein